MIKVIPLLTLLFLGLFVLSAGCGPLDVSCKAEMERACVRTS